MKRFFLFLSACMMQHSLLFAQSEQQLRDAQRAAFEARQVVDPLTGKIPVDKLLEAYQTTQQYAPKVVGPNWIEMGPKNRVGGRVRSIVISPDKKKMFAGGITGGLWVSNYADIPDWKPVSDIFSNLNVSTITYDPTNPNTMYLGTGEDYRNDYNLANYFAYLSDYNRGAGIWKSLDGGNTWIPLSATISNNDFVFRVVRKIVVDGMGRVFAATRWGVQKSEDGGNSWVTSLNGGDAILGGTVPADLHQVCDLEVGANNTVYASMGLQQNNSAIFKLVASSSVWWRLNDGETTNGMAISGKFRRIEIACAPNDANIVYAFTEDITTSPTQSLVTLYRSADKGLSWSKISFASMGGANSVNENFSQPYYSLAMAVNPNDANNVYLGGATLHRCNNVNATNPSWEQLSHRNFGGPTYEYIHSDQHEIVFEKATLGSPNIAYVASDGGIFKVSDLNRSSILGGVICSNYNNNLRISQLYTAAVSGGASTFNALGGFQDNGTEKFSKSYLWLTHRVDGGDGAYCFIHPNNTNLQVTSSQNGNYSIIKDGSLTPTQPSVFANTTPRGAFITPTDWSILGGDIVNMVSDGSLYGRGLTQIFRWNHIFGTNPTVDSFTHALLAGQEISFIKVSPNDNNRVYIGLNDRSTNDIRIVKVDNINSVTPIFTDFTGGFLAKGYISCIAIKKAATDNDMVFTLSNYGVQSVWKTDLGATSTPSWYSLDQSGGGSLPDMPIRWAAFPPGFNAFGHKLLLATETGVWTTDYFNQTNTVWVPMNNNRLPKVRTHALIYRETDGMLFAATHGRGLWRSDIYASSQVDFNAQIIVTRIPIIFRGRIIRWEQTCVLRLTDLSTGVVSRQWDVNNNGTIEGTSATLTVPYCGEQDVLLTVNGVGIVKRLQDFITIPTDCPACVTIEPDPIGLPVFMNKKASEEESIGNLMVYPNPNQGIFNIQMEPDWGKIEQIEVYNSTGKLIQTSELASGEINIEQEPTGVYICRVKTSNGKVLIGKVLKQ